MTSRKYGQKNPFSRFNLPNIVRRIESFIRTIIWHKFRKTFWYRLCKRVETLFSIGIKKLRSLSLKITLVRNRTLTARAIGVYAVRKLIAQNRLGHILKPIMRNLGFLFSGMKFSCKGRFTRRQRASLTVFSKGSIKLSTFTSDIDYTYAHVPLKFGVGCIKIWINRGFRNKNRVANKAEYLPFYSLAKNKATDLPDPQKARFSFQLTPQLKTMSEQLKQAYTKTTVTKRIFTQTFRKKIDNVYYGHRITTTSKSLLYKYARCRGTYSHRFVMNEKKKVSLSKNKSLRHDNINPIIYKYMKIRSLF